MLVDENKKTIFLSLIKNGLGLSGASAKMGLCPKMVSETYLSDPDWKSEIDNAFDIGLADLTLKREEALENKDDNLEELSKLLAVFPSQPTLWGCELNEFQLEELEETGSIPISHDMIKRSLAIHGSLREVATSFMLTYTELIEIALSDVELRKLLR